MPLLSARISKITNDGWYRTVAIIADLNKNGIYDDAPAVITDLNGDGKIDKKDLKRIGVASNIVEVPFLIVG